MSASAGASAGAMTIQASWEMTDPPSRPRCRSSSTHDALLIFECVRRGIMPKVPRRLRDDERKLIRSGSVFVFDEHESGIKRWTDGLLWSPSRILWNFLVSCAPATKNQFILS